MSFGTWRVDVKLGLSLFVTHVGVVQLSTQVETCLNFYFFSAVLVL